MKEVIVATLIVLVSGGTVTAQPFVDHAWFSLESTTGGATSTEGPGLALEILNAMPGEVLTIGYNFTDVFFPSFPMASWGINLTSTDGMFQNGDWGPSHAAGYNTEFGNPIQQNTFDVGGVSNAGNGVGGLVFTFEFVVNGAADVTGDFGSVGQFYTLGYRWYGSVGPNPISYGSPNYTGGPDVTPGWGSLPVVTVSMVPEPSSIALLAFGSFMIFRRKR